MTKLSPADLSKNARLINVELKAILEATETSAQHAITAGHILKACKDSVGHGEWAKWLGQNCHDISTRTASDYMWLAKHEPEIEEKLKEEGNQQRVADLSARALHGLIPKKPRTPATTSPEKKSGNKAAVQREVETKRGPNEIKELLDWCAADELFLVMQHTWDEEQIKALADLIADHLEARAKRDAETETQAEDPLDIPAAFDRRLQQPAIGGN